MGRCRLGARIGAGFLLGCWILGNRPRWPPQEDQDRLFIVVLPSVLFVELAALFPRAPRWLIWPLRAALIVGIAPALLYGSSYLSNHAGPGTADWSTVQAIAILGGLAALLAVVWSLLGLLSYRNPGLIHALCLAITSAGAAITVMLSGYATGGQNGLALAAALLGVATSMAALRWTARGTRPLGVAIVLLYSLLVAGRFFGELSSTHGILLFISPLLAWLPDLPGLRRLPSWARNLSRVLFVGLLVAVVLVAAARKALENHSDTSGTEEPSAADYAEFGR